MRVPGSRLRPAQMIVEDEPEAQQPRRAQARVMRQHEAQRPDDVRRGAPQHLAFAERLAHEAELVMFEIAQPAVDQLRGTRGRAARQIVLLAKVDAQAPPRGVARDAAAVDAAADDRDVEEV